MKRLRSPLADQIERFLKHKRALGLRYQREEVYVRVLDELALRFGASVIDQRLVTEYVAHFSAGSRPHCLTVIRQLARFAASEQSLTFVPPSRFLRIRRRPPAVRVLSRDECGRFLSACDVLPASMRWRHRGLIHGMALRLLLLTGLRRGEVLRLKYQDVDFDRGLLFIRESKFGKISLRPYCADRARSAPCVLQQARRWHL